MVLEALKFMVLGMGIVFIFLLVLVVIINLQAKLIAKFFPEEEKQVAQTSGASSVSNGISSKKVAAIIGAISEYRKSSKGL